MDHLSRKFPLESTPKPITFFYFNVISEIPLLAYENLNLNKNVVIFKKKIIKIL